MDILADNLVGLIVGVGDVADHLVAQPLARGLEGEGDDLLVPLLHLQLVVVDAVAAHPGRGAGLKTAQMNAQPFERLAQTHRGVQAVRAALVGDIAHIDAAVQEGAGADDGRLHRIHRAELGDNFFNRAALVQTDVADLRLDDVQALLLFQPALHLVVVGLAVRLDAQAVHRRALAPVEHPALQEGGVRRLAHLAAQRVDFPHQVALGGAANRGVAGHIADGVERHGEDGGFGAQPRRRQRRLDAGVPRADDGHLIASHCVFHKVLLLIFPKSDCSPIVVLYLDCRAARDRTQSISFYHR